MKFYISSTSYKDIGKFMNINDIKSRYYISTAFCFVLIACFALSGCSSMQSPEPNDPRYAPTIPDMSERPKPMSGSLFVEDSNLSLYQDIKANKVGDIITVKLVELTKASKDAKTNLKKAQELNTTISKLFNTIPSFSLRKIPLLSSKSRKTLDTDIDVDNTFKGNADSQQNNSLKGDITVTVAQVLPNSNLVIRGEKWITLNQGSEYIRLTGIVRKEDIGPNNEVLSTKVANARITYSGTGDLANTNRMGWLGKFFNSKIFPF